MSKKRDSYTVDETDVLRAVDIFKFKHKIKYPDVTHYIKILEMLGWRRSKIYKQPRIFLSVPYGGTRKQRKKSFRHATRVMASLMQLKHIVYSPITHNHPLIKVCNAPTNNSFWRRYAEEFIDWCDALYVLKLDGWETSVNVLMDIEYAIKKDKLIFYIDTKGK